MKKFLSVIMLVCIVMSMCTISAWAELPGGPTAGGFGRSGVPNDRSAEPGGLWKGAC